MWEREEVFIEVDGTVTSSSESPAADIVTGEAWRSWRKEYLLKKRVGVKVG